MVLPGWGRLRGRSYFSPFEPAHELIGHGEPLAYPQYLLAKKAWKKAVMGKKSTERPTNILTLRPTVHRLWEACFFALKPTRAISKRKLVVESHWLQPRPKAKKWLIVNARIRPAVSPRSTPLDSIKLLHPPPQQNNHHLWNKDRHPCR